jgi:hypothetical protein
MSGVNRRVIEDHVAERFVQAAADYQKCVKALPWPKSARDDLHQLGLMTQPRCRMALVVGSRVFSVPIDDLQAHDRGQLTAVRQQLMAFARVVSLGDVVPNSWSAIGRVFNRKHANVMHAFKVYGETLGEIINP